MKTKTLSVVYALALAGAVTATALLTIGSPTVSAATPPTAAPTAYLGVGLSAIPNAVGANLLANVPQGQGVMITQVEPGSPADQAGLAAYDILLSYGDQKLYSPDQLLALVQADPVGTKVAVKYVHQGELADTTVTLGARQAPIASLHGIQSPGNHPFGAMPPWFGQTPFSMPAFPRWNLPGWNAMPPAQGLTTPPKPGQQQGGNVMERFDSLSIQQINGKYKIEMSYLDADDVKHSFRYEGNADEVRKVIEDDDKLPDDKRQELLESLNMNAVPAFPDIRSLMERMGAFQHGGVPWGTPGW